MSVQRVDIEIPRLADEQLAAWAEVPAAVASDCLGRSRAMVAAIGPLDSSMRIVAQARTVECMAADNSALHAAIGVCRPGEVLVCDAQGFEDTALFGGLMTRSAIAHGLAGLVIDGAVRDSREIVDAGLACFCRAVVPAGPHKGFGGFIDRPIACGGVVVAPGDLVIADADGVTVVPFGRIDETLAKVHAVLERERDAMEQIAGGGSLGEIYGVPEIEVIANEP